MDFKSKRIAPAKLSRTISAFANADGGDLYIGIEDGRILDTSRWDGLASQEDGNAFLATFELIFPLGTSYSYRFISVPTCPGLVLHCTVNKSRDVTKATDGVLYLRRGAQNLSQTSEQQVSRLKYNKGLVSFEDHKTSAAIEMLQASDAWRKFASEQSVTIDANAFFMQEQLLVDGSPTVACALLYADVPQAIIPKSGIKIYRYKTSGEGARDTLASRPISVEGSAYEIIFKAVDITVKTIESVDVLSAGGLEKAKYPAEAIHEIITNAVVHRDYSINDDVNIRIFDNRIEIQSPGIFAGNVTAENALKERFARNPRVVRLLYKYENPPNMDIGEGLNTTFERMRERRLKDPVIEQLSTSVRVILKHETLASVESVICDYLRANSEISNGIVRRLTHIGSENVVKGILNKMKNRGLIRRVEGRSQGKTAYVRGPKFPD